MTHKFVSAALPIVILLLFMNGLAAAERQQSDSTQPDPIGVAPYAQAYESHIIVRADHTSTEVLTQRFKILTQGAIGAVGQQKLLFVAGTQVLDTVLAYTEKPDGRRILVELKGILTQDASTGQQATYLRDLKQRTVIFPDVAVGDTLVMTHRRETAPRTIFKQFAEHREFPRSGAFTSIKITTEAPLSMGLQVRALGRGASETIAQTGGTERHTIVITPQPYAPEESGAVSALDRDPVVLMSTYKSYGELVSSYGQTALPKVVVTPNIGALANEITKGIADRKAQAAAIDAWMKKNIRYVAVILGAGRVIPNDASTVLKNKFGDCKDHTTLMSALLAAKGIASEPALINLGNSYALPEPPTPAALNHVILYLPEFDLYDDPTANWAAFGVLAPQAYDKPVVRVSAAGAKIARTPAMKPEDHLVAARTTLTIAADGIVTGRTEESATGALGMNLRASAAAVQTLGDEAAAKRLLQKFLTPGNGHFELGNFVEPADPIVIKSSFTLDERLKPPPVGGRVGISHGMPLVAWPGTFLLGDRLSGRQSPFVCYAGRETEDIEASFDPALPMPVPFPPVTIDNPTFAFRANMTIEGRTLKSHREFISKVEHQVCLPDVETKIAADLNIVRANVFGAFAFASRPPLAPAGGLAAATALNAVRTVPVQPSPPAQNRPGANTPLYSNPALAPFMSAAPPPRPPQTQDATASSPPRPEATRSATNSAGSTTQPAPTQQGCTSQIPEAPDRIVVRVTGFLPAEQALAATRTVEAQLGAKISPAYLSLPRVSVENRQRNLKSMAAVPEQMTVKVGDVVEISTRYRDPSLPCNFIPWTINRQVDANLLPAAAPQPRSPQTLELTRFVAAGQRLRVEFLVAIEPDCSSMGQTAVRVIEQPAHGTLTVEDGQGFTNFAKDNQRYECNTRRSDGTLVFYEPKPDYNGADSITLNVIYPGGFAQTRHYSIEVK